VGVVIVLVNLRGILRADLSSFRLHEAPAWKTPSGEEPAGR
jgi:hypothetical protein